MEATRVGIDELKGMIDRGEPVAIVDTRNPAAWASSRSKIPGAIRISMEELEARADTLPRDREIITYCT
jgi:rhodanese-related sulfurtransferase